MPMRSRCASDLLTVAGVSPVALTSAADVAIGWRCSAWCTASAEAAARPRPAMRSRSALTSASSAFAVATACVALASMPSAKKSSQRSQSPRRRTSFSSS